MNKEIRLGRFDKWGYKNSFSKGELARELTYMNRDYDKLEQQYKKQKEVIDKAKSLNHEISHRIYEDFLEENIIGSKFLYERIKKQLSILEDKEVSE